MVLTIETAVATQTVGFLDIGTNSIRLLLVEIRPNHSHAILAQHKETVRLGENEFAAHRLQPAAIDRAVQVVRQFAAAARAAGADEIVAVATAATREAENQRLFLQRLDAEAGVIVHVVSGAEEARLVYLGVVSGLHLEQRQALCIDIGGGSTEVVVGTQDEHVYLNSLKLGSIRLTNLFLGDTKGRISAGQYGRLTSYIRNDSARTIHDLRQYRIDVAVGSSGTVENLAEIASRMFLHRPRGRDDALSLVHLKQVLAHLRSLTLEDRRRVPGINPDRADIIIGGGAILETIMDELSLPEVRISDRGLREGMLVDYLLRHGHEHMTDNTSVRAKSVLQLGRNCRFNEAHARVTARLALSLFDSTAAARLHRMGDRERELLEYTALLHHIGAFLTYSDYQAHTHYLIRNADLLGFDQTEVAIMADVALYHRKALPRSQDSRLAGLSPREKQTVRELSVLLRLAENLDRSQAGNVAAARIVEIDEDHAVLEIGCEQDASVELWGVQNQLTAFRKVFGRRLAVETNPVTG